jgi:NAD(P)-dependent dehydrogenase (short-subunit alcohol dehydrogenase family)
VFFFLASILSSRHIVSILQALLKHNAKVYMASRSPEKAKAAIEDLKAKTGKEALFLKLDLADLKSVKAAAEQFMRCVVFVFWTENYGPDAYPMPVRRKSFMP